MSARRNFLRNFSMAIVASLLPKVLQPAVPQLEEEETELAMYIDWESWNKLKDGYVYFIPENQVLTLLQIEARMMWGDI